MQRRGRLPGTIAYSGDKFSHRSGRTQRHRPAVAGECKAIGRETGDVHLHALDRGVHIADRARCRALLAHHVPRLERLAQLDVSAEDRDITTARKSEFEMRRKPFRFELVPGRALLAEHIAEIAFDEIRQHEAVMQLRTPACQPRWAVRLLPEA